MLVYLKEPMGYTTLDGHRVYGRHYNYGHSGAADIPRSLFFKHKDILEEAWYTKEWLEDKFGVEFPNVKFKTTKLAQLDNPILVDLARLVGIPYRKRQGLSLDEGRALRLAFIKRISE